jgi:hypothetical protein
MEFRFLNRVARLVILVSLAAALVAAWIRT